MSKIVSPEYTPIPSTPIDSTNKQDSSISKIGNVLEKKRRQLQRKKEARNVEDIIKRGLARLKQKAQDQQARE